MKHWISSQTFLSIFSFYPHIKIETLNINIRLSTLKLLEKFIKIVSNVFRRQHVREKETVKLIKEQIKNR